MDKKKIIGSILAVAAIFVIAAKFSAEKPTAAEEKPTAPQSVSVQAASDSKSSIKEIIYPASVVGDQEINITAKSAGIITIAPNNIGSSITAGAALAKIDETGLNSADSLQVQQSEIAVQQAKKSYELAKDIYNDLRDTSSSTRTEKDTAKTQKDIAKLQYENALLNLSGSISNHLITAPISGVITNKAVSIGDSVSAGQLIASISKSTNIKIQFYVDQEQLASLSKGQEISAIDAGKNSISLIIKNISTTADQTTKRFLIEAYPKQKESTLIPGTIISVSIRTVLQPQSDSNFILPLSSISTGQNESYIFIAENSIAKKTTVTISRVLGETAEISADIAPETLIITEGNKLVHEGETIIVNR